MRLTCADCPHLVRIDMFHNQLLSCGKTDSVVPHSSNGRSVTFYRVPMHCPLPDSEVKKREKPQPNRKCVTLSMDQLIETVTEIPNPAVGFNARS